MFHIRKIKEGKNSNKRRDLAKGVRFPRTSSFYCSFFETRFDFLVRKRYCTIVIWFDGKRLFRVQSTVDDEQSSSQSHGLEAAAAAAAAATAAASKAKYLLKSETKRKDITISWTKTWLLQWLMFQLDLHTGKRPMHKWSNWPVSGSGANQCKFEGEKWKFASDQFALEQETHSSSTTWNWFKLCLKEWLKENYCSRIEKKTTYMYTYLYSYMFIYLYQLTR